MAIDLNSLEYQYRRVAGGENSNQKATYGVEFASGGQNYTFIPTSVIDKGVAAGEKNYVLPWFLDKENMGTLGKTGEYVDLAGQSWYGDYLKDTVGASTTGFLVPSGSLAFDSKVSTTKQPVRGIAETEDGPAYILQPAEGKSAQYIKPNGNLTSITPGRSLLGKVFGGLGDDLAGAVNDTLGSINELGPWATAAISLASPPTGAVIAAANAGQAAATGDYEKAALNAAASYGLTQAGDGLLSGTTTGASAAPTTAGTTAGTTAAGTSGGLLSNAALDAQFIAADAAQLSAQGLSSAQIASTLQASGVSAMIAADAAQLAAQGLGAEQIASTIQQGLPTSTAASSSLFNTPTAATTAAGAGAATGAGALTASDLATAKLISGGLGLAGSLLQGDTTKSAMEADAAARAALAEKTMQMGKFQPVGTTTRFGTSSFVTDPTTGAITPSYTLSPEAKAYQDSLAALGTQGLLGGQTMMNLGQQYVGESPEAVRQRYMATQNALLAPGNEQTLAGLRTNLMNTGRQGLAYGATEAGGMGATNPELAAYYNSLATQQRQLAAGAETQYQNQVNFGTGLMGSATTPFTNVFTAQKGVEAAGQDPLKISTDFANTVATRGAAQGANYATAMSPSLQSSYKAANYNPYADTLSGMSDSDLALWGLKKLQG